MVVRVCSLLEWIFIGWIGNTELKRQLEITIDKSFITHLKVFHSAVLSARYCASPSSPTCLQDWAKHEMYTLVERWTKNYNVLRSMKKIKHGTDTGLSFLGPGYESSQPCKEPRVLGQERAWGLEVLQVGSRGGYIRGNWRHEEKTIIQGPCIPRRKIWTQSSMRNQKNDRSLWLLCGKGWDVRRRSLEEVGRLRVYNTSVIPTYQGVQLLRTGGNWFK